MNARLLKRPTVRRDVLSKKPTLFALTLVTLLLPACMHYQQIETAR